MTERTAGAPSVLAVGLTEECLSALRGLEGLGFRLCSAPAAEMISDLAAEPDYAVLIAGPQWHSAEGLSRLAGGALLSPAVRLLAVPDAAAVLALAPALAAGQIDGFLLLPVQAEQAAAVLTAALRRTDSTRRGLPDEQTEALRLEIERRACAEEEARLARELAEASNHAKTTFLANMSHELRTPLNAIIGFTEMILSELFGGIGNPVYTEYLRSIHESGHQLLTIINDILDISKIEVGQVALIETDVDLRDVVAAAMRLIRPSASSKKQQLSVHLPDQPLMVRCDNRILKQVLYNVLANAVKFTDPAGQISLTAELDALSPVIRISDTGIGIAQDTLKAVLQPFIQGDDDGWKRKFQGTGLGLPLAKGYMLLHGGDLELVSEPGQGTTVSLRLPRERMIQTA